MDNRQYKKKEAALQNETASLMVFVKMISSKECRNKNFEYICSQTLNN